MTQTDSCNADVAANFVKLLTTNQRELYTYICALLFDSIKSEDVLQDTNLDLWERMNEYDSSRPFLPWAYGFAYIRVLALRKKLGTSRLIFSDEIVRSISDAYKSGQGATDSRTSVLLECIDSLSSRHATLIRDRYMNNLSVTTLAQRMGCTVNQVSARLYRIRKSLAKCIASRLNVEFG